MHIREMHSSDCHDGYNVFASQCHFAEVVFSQILVIIIENTSLLQMSSKYVHQISLEVL